jgi:hypothetical protein
MTIISNLYIGVTRIQNPESRIQNPECGREGNLALGELFSF